MASTLHYPVRKKWEPLKRDCETRLWNSALVRKGWNKKSLSREFYNFAGAQDMGAKFATLLVQKKWPQRAHLSLLFPIFHPASARWLPGLKRCAIHPGRLWIFDFKRVGKRRIGKYTLYWLRECEVEVKKWEDPQKNDRVTLFPPTLPPSPTPLMPLTFFKITLSSKEEVFTRKKDNVPLRMACFLKRDSVTCSCSYGEEKSEGRVRKQGWMEGKERGSLFICLRNWVIKGLRNWDWIPDDSQRSWGTGSTKNYRNYCNNNTWTKSTQ